MTNKTRNLKIGHVEVTNVSMNRAYGYGQYTIATQIIFESKSETLNTHSTNSQLFDTLTDLENNTERAEYLMKNAKYIIENAIEEYLMKNAKYIIENAIEDYIKKY